MKKRLRKEINPEKSNKMIYAVALGLALVVVALFVIFVDLRPASQETILARYSEQIRRFDGLLEVQILPDEGEIELVYDQLINDDFPRRIQVLLKSLSRELGDDEFRVTIYRNNRDHPVLRYRLKEGRVLR